MHTHKKSWLKFGLTFAFCLLFRLLPFRPPNIEPLLTVEAPIAQVYGAYFGFLFGFLSIFIYDLLTSGIGSWTWVSAVVYGIIAFGAAYFFKHKKGTVMNYAIFAVLATLFFDAATGLTVGPLFFNQPFLVALTGQIPFTLMHLLGNVSFAVILSPAFHAWISTKDFSRVPLVSRLKFQPE